MTPLAIPVKKIVHKITTLIDSPEFQQRHRRCERDFTRRRTLTFATLVRFQLNMVRGALQDELNTFFATLEQNEEALERTVTDSAYCQARLKLKPSAYQELNQQLCEAFYQHAPFHRWHGLRVLAVDGSVASLPDHPSLWDAYGAVNPQSLHPSVRLSSLYDPLNQLTLDLQIAPCATGERELAQRHLQAARSGDLVLYDRGYPAFWLFALHRHLGLEFCMRAPWNLYNEGRDLCLSADQEDWVTLTPTQDALTTCRQLGIDASPIRVRMLHIDLPDSGETEILVTSLMDSNAYPYEEFSALYHLRWFTEEAYKTSKSRLEIENLTGYAAQTVEQDIRARWLTLNINAALLFDAQRLLEHELSDKALKYDYRVNRANSLRQLKHNIVRLLQRSNPLPFLRQLIAAMVREREPMRPGRAYSRNKTRPKPRFPMRYKRV